MSNSNNCESNELTIQLCYMTFATLMMITCCLAFHNVIQYIIRRKLRAKLIIIFYAMVISMCITEIALYIYIATEPCARDPLFFGAQNFTFEGSLMWLSSTFNMAICFLYPLIILEMIIILRYRMQENNEAKANQLKLASYILAIVLWILLTLMLILAP